jgi:cell division protein FtsA
MRAFVASRYGAAIDLGSSKICCWMAETEEGSPSARRLLGLGHVASRGLWAGNFTDLTALQGGLSSALYQAEQQAGIQIRQAVLTLSDSFFSTQTCQLQIPISQGVVGESDLASLYGQIQHPQMQAMAITPLEFAVDQQRKIKDPRSMVGQTLQGQFHVTWMDKGRLQTLQALLKRCQVQVSQIMPSTQASARACLGGDEQDLGCALIDFGASSTSLSLFLHGARVASLALPMGGHTITQDIARGCDTSLAHSERLKILHGAAQVVAHDHHDSVPIFPFSSDLGAPDSSEPYAHVPRSFLITIIQSRCEELLSALHQALEGHPYAGMVQRVVMTGGASQLPGLRELASRIFRRTVRIANPSPMLQGAPDFKGEFSSVFGALLSTADGDLALPKSPEKTFSLFSWIKKKV